jgi:hypothetical protein
MTVTSPGWDAAPVPDPAPDQDDQVPGAPAGTTFQWCEVYIGGSSAFHVWTQTERNRVDDLPKLPVWVPTPGFDNPRQSALACVASLHAAGVPAYATPWRAVMIDLETGKEPDQPWLAGFQAVTVQHGYDIWPYGSTSWIFGYADYSGLLVAQYDGSADLDALRRAHPGRHIVGKQYRAGVGVPGGVVDLDVLDAAALPHLGHWG